MTTFPTKLVSTALALTIQEWTDLSLGDDPVTMATEDRDTIIDRVTALLLIRIVACVSPSGAFPDWGTSSMCRTMLQREKTWPLNVDELVITQLREFVKKMIKGYKDVEYHSMHHAYHVIISCNKLIDMMVSSVHPVTGKRLNRLPPTFGLRSDPISLMALMFAALVHDVEHQGIPNRQLSIENDRLAILYNDQSIAENWSLYVAFSELLQDDFSELRKVMFDDASSTSEKYKLFRRTVVSLVLQTDIASPERTQIAKSKWKEAFGDTHEAVEAKIRSRIRRMSIQGKDINISQRNAARRFTGESQYSEITFQQSTGDGTSGANTAAAAVAPAAANTNNNDGSGNPLLPGPPESESPSGTPDNSFHGDEEDITTSEVGNGEVGPIAETPAAVASLSRRSSGGGASSQQQRMSREEGRLASAAVDTGRLSLNDLLSTTSHSVRSKFERRQSNASHVSGRYRQRLGILRTIDLSGESLETYSRHESSAFSSHSSVVFTVADAEMDEPDELKSIVVLETLLTAADVAHNLQSWEHMVKWSGRLYNELRKAHITDRGPDVSRNWFENQIGFLESYLLPLARRLEDTGVFGEEVGAMFPRIVEDNRDRWLTEGYDISQKTIEEGAQKFPSDSA